MADHGRISRGKTRTEPPSGVPRTVAVVTTGRADYWLLVPVLRALDAIRDTVTMVYATGTHLSEQHGRTVERIEADGWHIAERILSEPGVGDAPMAEKMARCATGFARAFHDSPPDTCVLLGDRFETLAAATAASASGIPICHIHGGELSTGALDNQFRYAITALANLHCVATAKARDRLIAMGESPDAVIRTGAPGLDHVAGFEPMPRDRFCHEAGLKGEDPFLLVTLHPETIGGGDIAIDGNALDACLALERALIDLGMPCLVTAANQDQGGAEINKGLKIMCEGMGCPFVESLGPLYHHAMHHAAVMVGNSSSGIIEAASFGLPVVNIGERQGGRERSGNVVDCATDHASITDAVRRAVAMDVSGVENVYAAPEGESAGERIAAAITAMPLGADALRKRFEPPGLS